eukprot:scaffold34901_cov59-Attheya_sp.AAC.3
MARDNHILFILLRQHKHCNIILALSQLTHDNSPQMKFVSPLCISEAGSTGMEARVTCFASREFGQMFDAGNVLTGTLVKCGAIGSFDNGITLKGAPHMYTTFGSPGFLLWGHQKTTRYFEEGSGGIRVVVGKEDECNAFGDFVGFGGMLAQGNDFGQDDNVFFGGQSSIGQTWHNGIDTNTMVGWERFAQSIGHGFLGRLGNAIGQGLTGGSGSGQHIDNGPPLPPDAVDVRLTNS